MPNRLTWTQMQKAVQTALRVTQAAIDASIGQEAGND